MNPLEWQKHRPGIRGTILYSKVWGSHSHDTQMPDSDVDYTGVYVANTRDLLGLNPPPDTLTGEKPDYQIHEIRKFCDLLIKGNPGIIEMLFTEKFQHYHPDWEALRAIRNEFLTETVVKQYIGYSKAQLKRFRHSKPVHSKGGVAGEKWCYHMVRVAWDAERIAQGQGPKVWKEGLEKEILMKIRYGEMSPCEAMDIAEKTIDRVDGLKPWNVNVDAPEEALEDWLLIIRGV